MFIGIFITLSFMLFHHHYYYRHWGGAPRRSEPWVAQAARCRELAVPRACFPSKSSLNTTPRLDIKVLPPSPPRYKDRPTI